MPTRMWLRPPSAGDILHVARNMREMDAREIFAMTGVPDPDLFAAVVATRAWRAAYGIGLDENPFCAAFVGLWSDPSAPWLVDVTLFATADFPRLAPPLIRFLRQRLLPAMLAQGVHRAECRALASYTATRRFLKACGATEEAVLRDQGVNRETYVLCAWRRCDFEGSAHVPDPAHAKAEHR